MTYRVVILQEAEDGIRPEKIVILRRGLRRNQVREGDL